MTVIFSFFDGTGVYDPATAPGASDSRAGIVGPVAGVTYNNRLKMTKRMTDGSNTSNPTQYASDSGGPTGFAPVRHAYFADPTSPSGWAFRIRSNVSGGESGNRYQMGLGTPNLVVPTTGVIERWETQVIRYNGFKLAEIGPSNAGHFATFGSSHRFTNGLNGPYMNTDLGVPVGHHYININLTGSVISNQAGATAYKDLGPVVQATQRMFEWNIGWSRTSAGFLKVYVDGVLVHSYSGITVYSGGANIEYRTGSYYGSAYTTAPEMEVLHLVVATTRAEAAPAGTSSGGGTVTPPPTTVAMRTIADPLDSATASGSIFNSFTGTATYSGGSLQLNATQAEKVASAVSDPKYTANADGLVFGGIAWPDKSAGSTGTLEARFVTDFSDGDRFVFRRRKVWGTALTGVTGVTSTDIFTKTAHGLVAGDTVQFTGFTGGANITPGQMYYVIAANLAANTFQVSASAGGTAYDLGTDVAGATVTKFQDFFSMYVREAEVVGGMTNFDAPTAIAGINAIRFVFDANKLKVNVHASNDGGATFTQDLGGVPFLTVTTDKPVSIAVVSQIIDGDVVPTTFSLDAITGTTSVGLGGGTGAGTLGSDGMTFNRTQKLQFPAARLTLPFYWLFLARRGTGTAQTNLGGLTKDGTNLGRWLTWHNSTDATYPGQIRLYDAVGGATQSAGVAGPTANQKWCLIMAGETTAKQVVIHWADVDPVPIDAANRFHHNTNTATLGTGAAVTSTAARFIIGDGDFTVGTTNFEGDQRMVAVVADEPLTDAAFDALVTSNIIVLRSLIAALPNLAAFKELADANAGSSSTGTVVVDRVTTTLNEELASRSGTTTAYAGTDVPYDTAGGGGTTPPPTGGAQVPTPTNPPTASAQATSGTTGSFTLTGTLPVADASISFTPNATAAIRFFYSDDGVTLTAIAGWQSAASVSVTGVPLGIERSYYYKWRNNDPTPKEGDYSPALVLQIDTPAALAPLATPVLTKPPTRSLGGLAEFRVAIPPTNQSVDEYHVYMTPLDVSRVATGAEFTAFSGAGATVGGEVILSVTGLSDAVPFYHYRLAAWRVEP